MKQLFLLLFCFVSLSLSAQDKLWSDATHEAAYEAPTSKLINKWYQEDGCIFVIENNSRLTFIIPFTHKELADMDEAFRNINLEIIIKGTWNREKDRLNFTYNPATVSTKISNQAEVQKLSAMKKDRFNNICANIKGTVKANLQKKSKDSYFFVRLDDDYLCVVPIIEGRYTYAGNYYWADSQVKTLISEKKKKNDN